LNTNLEIGVADLAVPQTGAPLPAGGGNGNGPSPACLTPYPSEPFDLTAVLEKAEKELIVRTLTSTGGAQAEAARRMGLSRSALAYKLTKYGIRSTE